MTPLHSALTPPALVLAGLRSAIVAAVPNLSFIYDPVLHWGEAARAQRAQRDMQADTTEDGAVPDQGSGATQYPLMGWNRSAVTPMEGRSRRNTFGAGSTTVGTPNQDWDLRAFFGQVVFRFKIYARDVLELEALEMAYVTNALISDITKFAIPIPSLYPSLDLADVPAEFWSYDVQWDPLQPELEVERRPAMVFAIAGSATVRGCFMTGAATPHYPLRTINCSIMDMQQQFIEGIVVTRNN